MEWYVIIDDGEYLSYLSMMNIYPFKIKIKLFSYFKVNIFLKTIILDQRKKFSNMLVMRQYNKTSKIIGNRGISQTVLGNLNFLKNNTK